jgi:hypothetical protein
MRLQAAFQTLGVSLGAGESYRIAGGDVNRTKEIELEILAAMKRSKEMPDIAKLAEATAPTAMKRGAKLETRKRAIGRTSALPVAQAFEEGQLGVTAQVARLAPEMAKAAKGLGDMAASVTEGAVDLIKRLETLVDKAENLPWTSNR